MYGHIFWGRLKPDLSGNPAKKRENRTEFVAVNVYNFANIRTENFRISLNYSLLNGLRFAYIYAIGIFIRSSIVKFATKHISDPPQKFAMRQLRMRRIKQRHAVKHELR